MTRLRCAGLRSRKQEKCQEKPVQAKKEEIIKTLSEELEIKVLSCLNTVAAASHGPVIKVKQTLKNSLF